MKATLEESVVECVAVELDTAMLSVDMDELVDTVLELFKPEELQQCFKQPDAVARLTELVHAELKGSIRDTIRELIGQIEE